MTIAIASFAGFSPLTIAQILIAAFMAALFLQSGLDKVLDYKGNRAYLSDHFKNSPLASLTGLLIPVITLLEVAAGACSAIGVLMLLLKGDAYMAWVGQLLAALALLSLFTGQRLAKDYAGAATLVPYFLAAMMGLALTGQ